MGKFCGKCGNMLTEKGVCPACGWSLNTKADTPATSQRVKKPKKKLIAIIAIVLAVVILGGGAFGVLTLKGMFAHKNYQPSYVYEMKDGSTIISFLKEDKNGELSFLKPESDEFDYAVRFFPDYAVSDGKYIYYNGSASTPDYYSSNNLLRYEIKDNKAIATPILTEEQIRDYFDIPEDNRNTGDLLNTYFSEFVIDGDYIYFELGYDLGIDIRGTSSVYRVKLSGGDLEPVIDNEKYAYAFNYTVYKDYIYYIGFNDDNSFRNLCKRHVTSGDTEVLRRTDKSIMEKLSYHDGYIYFYEHSGDEQLLSRIKTNGKGYEVITDNHPFAYTFSDNGKEIYYLSYDRSDHSNVSENPNEYITGTTINKVSLSGKNDTEICKIKTLEFYSHFSRYTIDYSDRKLYVGDPLYPSDTFYYDLSSEKAYLLETEDDKAYWDDKTDELIAN